MRSKTVPGHTVHCIKDYFRDVALNAHELQIHRGHTDIVFHVDEERVHAHKVMFIPHSKLLCSLFQISAEKQSPAADTCISLPGFSKSCVDNLLNYIYQGQTILKNTNERDELYMLAKTLDITLHLREKPESDREPETKSLRQKSAGERKGRKRNKSSEVSDQIKVDQDLSPGKNTSDDSNRELDNIKRKKKKRNEISEYADQSEKMDEDFNISEALVGKHDNIQSDASFEPGLAEDIYDRATCAAKRQELNVKVKNCLNDEEVKKYLPAMADSFPYGQVTSDLVSNPLYDMLEEKSEKEIISLDKVDVQTESTPAQSQTSDVKGQRGRKRKEKSPVRSEKPQKVSDDKKQSGCETETGKNAEKNSGGNFEKDLEGECSPSQCQQETSNSTGNEYNSRSSDTELEKTENKVNEEKAVADKENDFFSESVEKKEPEIDSKNQNTLLESASELPEAKSNEIDEDAEEDYEVEKILDKKGKGKGLKYLVKWKGWDNEEDFTWEPLKNLANVDELIKEFEGTKAKSDKGKEVIVNQEKDKKKAEKKTKTDKVFKSSAKDTDSNNPSMCKYCMRIFLSHESLLKHSLEEHSDTISEDHLETADSTLSAEENEMFACFNCSKTYKKSEELRNHILDHFKSNLSENLPGKKPFKCPTCNKNMNTQLKLLRHSAFDHKEILKYCTEAQLGGMAKNEDGIQPCDESLPIHQKSPSPYKKMDVSFSDSEDESPSKIQEKLKNVTKTFDDLFGPDVPAEKESRVVYNKDSDESDAEEKNVDDLLESDSEKL